MKAKKNAIKRMIAICLTAIMTLAMATTAFAKEADAVTPMAEAKKGSLTVNVNDKNTLENQTINLYKLFDLSVSAGAGSEKNYAYTVNTQYEEILKNILKITEENPTSQTYYDKLSGLKGGEVQKFADDFTKAVLARVPVLTPDYTSGKISKGANSHTFDSVDYGHYLVYQTGTKEIQSSLVSVDEASVEVALKGEAPSIEKSANVETVEIGQVVTYTIKGTIPDTTGYKNYVYKIKDTLTSGLDFVTDVNGQTPATDPYGISVQIDGENVETQNASLGGDDNRTMTLDLSEWIRTKSAGGNAGKTFTVTYYAKVNKNAVVQTNNSASLEYGNDSSSTTETTPDVVTTPTYPLDINKTDNAANRLAGAKFRLYRAEDDAKNNPDNAIKVTDNKDGSYTVADKDAAEKNMDMVTVGTDIGGKGYNLHLNGLAAGDYWLVETEAPAGYNKLTAPVKITIAKSGTTNVGDWTISKGDTVEKDKIIDIENSTGTILPETGGMGTVLFTVVAVVLILGVAISFIRSRRKEA